MKLILLVSVICVFALNDLTAAKARRVARLHAESNVTVDASFFIDSVLFTKIVEAARDGKTVLRYYDSQKPHKKYLRRMPLAIREEVASILRGRGFTVYLVNGMGGILFWVNYITDYFEPGMLIKWAKE